jgi:AcrR family transcriptional regulator
MTFKKRGRPPEDRLARRNDIFTAVSPLILERGARGLTMEAAAHAACLSVGALYYYFPTKRDLLLHGLDAEAIEQHCRNVDELIGHLERQDPCQFFELLTESFIEGVMMSQPSMQAAIELGAGELQTALEQVRANLSTSEGALANALRRTVLDLSETEIAATVRATRRIILGALVDADITAGELRSALRALFGPNLTGSLRPQRAAAG